MQTTTGPTGCVARVDRGAFHDGPGLRTVVFLKGCPLRCAWCHSPETQSTHTELLIRGDRCIGCATCVAACEAQAVRPTGGRFDVDRRRCRVCGRCMASCPTGARELVGATSTVDDVMCQVLSDRVFYDQTGGGVTVSGGEPLLQPVFLLALLERCRAHGLHTAVETCGVGDPALLLRAAALTDLLLYDVKVLDEDRHRRMTGASNRGILANLRALAAAHRNVVVRMPIVPGINDDGANVSALGALVAGLGLPRVELLPYHRAGVAKYARLGRTYSLEEVAPPSAGDVEAIADVLRGVGLAVSTGGTA